MKTICQMANEMVMDLVIEGKLPPGPNEEEVERFITLMVNYSNERAYQLIDGKSDSG